MQRALRDVIAIAGDAERKKDQGYGRRQREASPSSQRPAVSSPRQSYRYADLAACRPWQELTKRDQVSIAPFGEPAPPCDKFGAEVAQVRNGAAKRCQSKPQKNKKDRPWSAVIGRVIRHTFAFMICNELINKRNSITKFDINLEKIPLCVLRSFSCGSQEHAYLRLSVLYFPFSEAIPRSSDLRTKVSANVRSIRATSRRAFPWRTSTPQRRASAAQPRRYHPSRRPERSEARVHSLPARYEPPPHSAV
ncbi:hypothetical protein BANRA_05285 [Klebsiella pneumoniae]|nr:hypothetical protein BANRA_05285 [Klebsiella pneumoniae]